MTTQQFPTLKEMGFDDVSEIERFSSRIEGDTDILKIYFHREQGDWFGRSKKFKFKRLNKRIRVNEGQIAYRDTTESSPYFLRAMQELEQLVSQANSSKDRKELILEEIDHLEKVVQRKIADLRKQIEDL
ncbi:MULTISPECIES: DUF3461 family protein [Nitrincola]|uniref:DUF3461 family protein n=1 Tax=Nitrincola nitratireducens TaxID=1229521 RepID=W9VRG2_9GAMM|nr:MULTISPECIES: DUF3461 family protein [Nitrincola]EXJ12995.1 hypothetical protein D791_00338 [Nitrincola nitratireducens]